MSSRTTSTRTRTSTSSSSPSTRTGPGPAWSSRACATGSRRRSRCRAVDGYLIGESFLDRFTYNGWAGAGYFHLQTSTDRAARQLDRPERRDRPLLCDAGGDAPFDAGPVKVVPYAKLLLADYTNDLDGDNRRPASGAAAASAPASRSRASTPTCRANCSTSTASTTRSWSAPTTSSPAPTSRTRDLPQLDRLNDDVTNQALHDLKPLEPRPLTRRRAGPRRKSPMFDPQVYAIRKLVDNRIDTLDNIDELQLDVRQRWQTKRGFPGDQHIVDWMTLDVSAHLLPGREPRQLRQAVRLPASTTTSGTSATARP